jgi:3-hydroxyisobutyrate dehydrogenase-like beta-hydroxyacid dehydrogenase
MSEISVKGFGLMGAALASQLPLDGHNMTVWNRSPEKMKPFLVEGVYSVVEAVTASPVAVVWSTLMANLIPKMSRIKQMACGVKAPWIRKAWG